MKISFSDEPFSPDVTFESGQCFRWRKNAQNYCGIVAGQVLTLTVDATAIELSGASEQTDQTFWRHYFSLDLDYAAIREELSALHPFMAQAISFSPGLRLLRQDPWETLCSFLISQNNHIPRIKGIIDRFCAQFGQPLKKDRFSFPTAAQIAGLSPEDLAPLRCGYRAKYLIDAAEHVASGQLDLAEIAQLPLPQARTQLQTIQGVGPKVAECVLLYGMGRWEAFPVDVWIKRVMTAYFPGKTAAFFGRYAGIAQQYLFCLIRQKTLLTREPS